MSTPDDLVRSYLSALEAATADLPAEVRDDLLTEIRAHLDQAAADGDEPSVRNAIDRLGTPTEIAASARAAEGLPATTLPTPPGAPLTAEADPVRSSRSRDRWTVLTLLLGPVVVALVLGMIERGLLLIGVVAGTALGWALLWTSTTWTTRQKLLGSLVWPGGFVTPFVVQTLATSVCTESTGPGGTEVACEGFSLPPTVGIPLAILVWLAPITVGVFLLRRADRQRRPA
ncbi:MAG: DUF1700 domain-containing protein [Nitriliruptoraceae bacterium]